ncbi:MAG: protein kinase [Planctomycetes bacterium]|nr:protein kinase [Planctomycetota bacterium]
METLDPPPHDEAAEEAALDELFELAIQLRGRGEEPELAAWLVGREHLRERAQRVVELAASIAVASEPKRASRPQIAGFELLTEVGRGGMGIVYRARQTALGRIVALKILAPAWSISERSRQRFLAEARALARLHHPEIVAIHDILVSDELCAYVMEWIDGATLAERIAARDPRLDAPGVARLGVAIANALEAVHRAGIVHRDVKPSNILLRADGRPVLSDFGLVRDAEQSFHTASGEFVGTAAFAAPEQIRGEQEQVGPWSDVYALGITLFTALAGETPFGRNSSSRRFLRRIEHGEGTSLRKLVPAVPRDLETILAKAIEREPRQRYASARELAEDLGRFLRCEPIRARPVSVPARLLRWVLRSPRLAAALAALLLSLSAGLAVALVLLRRSEDEREHAEQRAYSAHLAAAEAALRANDPVDARMHLQLAPERYRHWEWRYLEARLDPSRTLGSHDELVNGLAVDPLGQRCATASADRSIRVWEIEGGELLRHLAHPAPAFAVSWSRDGALFATGCEACVKLWDGVSLDLLATFPVDDPTRALLFDPRSDRLAIGAKSGQLELYESAALREQAELVAELRPERVARWPTPLMRWKRESSVIHALAFGVGDVLASTSMGGIWIWSPSQRRSLATLPIAGNAWGLCFDPLGQRVAAGANDGVIRVFDLARGGAPQEFHGHTGRVTSLAWSTDGRQLASASLDRTLRVWEADGRPASIHLGHSGGVRCLAFLPGNRRIISAAGDRTDCTVRLWDVVGEGVRRLQMPGGHRSVHIVAAPERRWCASFSYAPEQIFLATGSLDRNDLTWRRVVARTSSLELDVSPDGRSVVLAAEEGALLFDFEELQRRAPEGEQELESLKPSVVLRTGSAPASAVAFGPDHLLLVGHRDGSLVLWDCAEARILERHSIAGGPILDAVISADGERFAALTSTRCEVYDQATGALGDSGWSLVEGTAIGLSRDGRLLAFANGAKEPRITVRDLGAGRELGEIRGPTDVVTGLAFSPDGARLAASSEDRVLRLWDPASGMLALTLHDQGYRMKSVAWSTSGEELLSSGRDGSILIRSATRKTVRAD